MVEIGLLPKRVAALYEQVLREPGNAGLVAALALTLADSGSRRQPNDASADIASTGGPSSLSTLLCPLFLVDMGLTVPKVGVAGRPAGGIDVLGAIPGYRTHLLRADFDAVVDRVGYAHVAADQTWAPADAALFRLRQERGTQAQPSLAAASLLSKKLAAGVQVAGLDARIGPHGNFGTDWPVAQASAEVYCEAGRQLGLEPIVFLTDASVPYQPFIGRGEALAAVTLVVRGTVDDYWLREHVDMCHKMARIVRSVAMPRSTETASDIASGGIARIMAANLEAQGASTARLEAHLSFIAQQQKHQINAAEGGFVHYNLAALRDLVTRLNMNRVPSSEQPDHCAGEYLDMAGVRLLCHPHLRIQRGDAVVEVRGGVARSASETRLFTIEDTPAGLPNVIREVVVA